MTKSQPSSTPPEGKPRYVLLDEDTVNRLIDANLTGSQYRAFLYFSLVDPFGNRFIDTGGPMARQRLDISKSTYYGALAALQTHEFFDFEDVTLRVRSKVGSKSPEKLFDERIVLEIESESEKSNPSPKNRTQVRKIELKSEKSESQSPEGFSSNDSETLQYSSIALNNFQSSLKLERDTENSKFKIQNPRSEVSFIPGPVLALENSLSLPIPITGWDNFSAADDPAFFDFVLHQRVPRLPKPPASAQCVAEGWIRKDGSLLYEEYQQWQAAQRRFEKILNEPPSPPEHSLQPAADSLATLTPAQHLARYRGLWDIPNMRPSIRRSIAEHPEWGLEVGPAGPRLLSESVLGDRVAMARSA